MHFIRDILFSFCLENCRTLYIVYFCLNSKSAKECKITITTKAKIKCFVVFSSCIVCSQVSIKVKITLPRQQATLATDIR